MKESEPTPRELAAALGQKKPGRYAVSAPEERTCAVDGKLVVFASKHEMDFYLRFISLQRGGAFTGLRRQVKYPLHTTTPNGFKVEITYYKADIVCEDRNGKTCVFEPKGVKTPRWKMIRKWMEAEYGIRIVEL